MKLNMTIERGDVLDIPIKFEEGHVLIARIMQDWDGDITYKLYMDEDEVLESNHAWHYELIGQIENSS